MAFRDNASLTAWAPGGAGAASVSANKVSVNKVSVNKVSASNLSKRSKPLDASPASARRALALKEGMEILPSQSLWTCEDNRNGAFSPIVQMKMAARGRQGGDISGVLRRS